ncbi:Signal-transducing adaptor protein 2 [Labeo rohita]|uniref:Signal-transducing adaptor protein 2 n=1 Tax=Labeo rohita TaxID=84645 RepID=A0ABQ8MHW4_LABRO|nr:Signal-transducing adaptor protein 2 [Labeo rohita]
MAAANRYRRVKSQLPTCYYEGFLEKKKIKDKYVEKLELSDLVTVTDDSGRDRNLDAASFTLHMKNEDIKMTAPNLETRELWKGYLLSVSKLSVPGSLNLLPGQIHSMKEIIEKEKIRQRLLSSPPSSSSSDYYITVQCYHNVSRVEAEFLLERNADRGNLLLRPGRDGTSFALTTRQDVNGPVFRHYRVSRRHEGGFTIALEAPITCETLHDVVNCMLEKTNGVLVPLLMEDFYAKCITFAETDKENGERSVQCSKSSSPVLPPKPAFLDSDDENGETIVCCPQVPSPTPPVPPPKPVPRNQRSSSDTNTRERIYLNVPDAEDYVLDEAANNPPPVFPRLPDGEKKALVPPGYPKTTSRSNSLSSKPKNFPKTGKSVDMNELQEALRRRQKE